jgi:hypothetical protein
MRKDPRVKLRLLSAVFAVLLTPGCVMVQIGVTNPIPGLTTVAVAPFINLSPERAVDGRRFALAYASELQKVPGFEVIPVGVAEVAMVDAKIDLNDVDDVLKLAKILRVDAVVVGAVTEYSPYYPPRIGMQVSWYSPKSWSFYPGIQTEPAMRSQLREWDQQKIDDWRAYHKQQDEQCAPETPIWLRAYHCFQKWPVIRNFYGDPSLVWSERSPGIVYRAQSPATTSNSVLQPNVLQPLVAGVPAGTEFETLIKTAHYQEPQGTPEVVRVALMPDDRDSRYSGSADSQIPLPMPSTPVPPPPGPPAEATPAKEKPAAVAAPLEAGQPAPFPGEMAPGTGPLKSPMGIPADALPFGPEAPALRPVPLSPLGPTPANPDFDGPPQKPEEPAKPAVRNPALAPLPPQPNPYNVPQPIQPWQANPRLPLMAYTRVFDGSDADLVAALRDYVELNGDLRSGGWEGYLHRSDDFVRFTAYRMIQEMLSLHGGEGKHRMIFKFRKYR